MGLGGLGTKGLGLGLDNTLIPCFLSLDSFLLIELY